MKLELPDYYKITNQKFIDKITKDFEKIKEKPVHYFFTGGCGTGKTELAKIITNHFKNFPHHYFVKKKAYKVYREYINNKNRSEFFEAIASDENIIKKNLFIDDLGGETPRTEASRNFFEEIISSFHRSWLSHVAGCGIN